MVEFKKQGIDLFVANNAIIRNPHNVEIGNHVAIDYFVYLSTSAKIGDYVHISPGVSIIGGVNSTLIMEEFSGIASNSTIICGGDDFTSGTLMNPQIPIKYRQPKIGCVTFKRFSCLGVNCTVMPNVTLAEGSVVGAGSVVTKDTEPWMVYAGSPAKPIKPRNSEQIIESANQLMNYND